jgi:apolipoprotein N-acyltransferase
VLALAAVGGVWLISFALVLTNVAIVLVIGSLPGAGAIPRPKYPPDPDALASASLVLPGLSDLTTTAVSALT